MAKKFYPQSFKETVVKFYERNHTIAETLNEFGISESSLFEWKKKYDTEHYLYIDTNTSIKRMRQSQMHLEKTEKMLEVIHKASCGVNASIDEKMKAIEELEGQYSVHILCEALNLPRGTYYNRKKRKLKQTTYERNDNEIKPLIKEIFIASKERFGRKPIHQKLLECGYRVDEKRISRLMKEMNLAVKRPEYVAEHKKPLPRKQFKNYLQKQFDQNAPNKVWVTDITYVKVDKQYYSVCVFLDLFSRKVLSYGLSQNIDSTLVMHTFDSAFQKRNKPQNLMIHSDQGAAYTAYYFREYTRELGVKQSFSSPGNPYDNSVCESFFQTLKKEAIYHHLYSNPDELKNVLNEYIEFYNNDRPHRKLNMKTPNKFEMDYIKKMSE